MIIWLASYPKSGNTWLRFYIISLLMGKRTKLNLNHLKAISAYPHISQFKDLISDYLNLNEVAKNWITSQERLNSDKSLRFFKTHNMLGSLNGYPFTNKGNTLGTIHIVRDPRNVITSVKNHYNFITLDEALKFLFNEQQIVTLSDEEKKKYKEKDTKYPLPQIIGSWSTHFNSWKKMNRNYLLVKYEDLVENPEETFTKIAFFIGNLIKLSFTNDQIKTAIDLSSFEKLEKMEKDYGFTESTINKKGEKNKFFYLGPKNDWKEILDKKTSDEISKKFEPEMQELGYI